MKRPLVILMLLPSLAAHALTIQWTNVLGGSWSVASYWSPNTIPAPADTVIITNAGYYIISVNAPVGVSNLTLGGPSGLQTVIYKSEMPLMVGNLAFIASNGVLRVVGAGVTGNLTVQPDGSVEVNGLLSNMNLVNQGGVALSGIGASNVNVLNQGVVSLSGTGLTNVNLLNEGTVRFGSGDVTLVNTIVTNTGLWLTAWNNSMLGNGTSIFSNSGIFQQMDNTGTNTISGVTFLNEPSGLVDAASGLISFSTTGDSFLGGTFNATWPAAVSISGTSWTEGGGIGTGYNSWVLFTGGTLNLVSNNVSGIYLVGGDIYITGANTFQQGGIITNLELDGATMCGTNTVGNGTLILQGLCDIIGQITIQPSGQLVLGDCGNTSNTNTIINNGTVIWTGSSRMSGSTVISNGGFWQIVPWNDGQPDYDACQIWTNSGMVQKIGDQMIWIGTLFVNEPDGVVEVDAGTLVMPSGTTNSAGTLFLNGGTLTCDSTLGFTGGLLEGSGSIGDNFFTGGTISPGINGPGAISFNADLNLSSGVTLMIDGIGTVPGLQYDQLSVNGGVALGNATLKVTFLPAVPVGTTFVVVANNGGNPVSGTFNGLPESALLTVSGQPFRIHYAGGAGNDVTLVRDPGPLLASTGSIGGNVNLTGFGPNSGTVTIQATTNLINWTNIGTGTGDTNGHFTFTDTNAFLYHYRFYRTTN